MKNRLLLAITLITMTSLQGCADNVIKSEYAAGCTVKSNPVTKNPSCSHGVRVGLVYSLPKGQVLLTASRKVIGKADVAKAESSLATADQALSTAISKLAAAKAAEKKDAVPAESDVKKAKDHAAVAAARAELDADTASASAAKETLATVKTAVGKKYIATFSLTPLPIVPDGRRQFVADLAHFQYRDDTLKLGVVNGLLTTASTESTDETPSIISSLVSAAVGLTTFIGAGTPVIPSGAVAAPPSPAKPGAPKNCAYAISTVFDPTNPSDINAINTKLKKASVQAHIRLRSSYVSRIDRHPLQVAHLSPSPTAASGKLKDARPIDGLVYRAAVATQVMLVPTRNAITTKNCPLEVMPKAQSIQVIAPDTNSEFIVPVKAGAMTSSSFNFGFSSGMLTDYDVVRPSEWAAVASVPVDIINKIMTIPTSIFKLRLDYSTAQTNLAKQQAALVTAKSQQALALINAKTALATAETQLMQADLNNPAARYAALTAIVQARQALANAIIAASKPVVTSGK